MNVLFLTLININSPDDGGIYPDLLREFLDHGHKVTVVTAAERRTGAHTGLTSVGNFSVLRVRTLNIQKTNVIEKGLGTLMLEYQFTRAIKRFLREERFDLVLYSTPPVTFLRPIYRIRKRDKACCYLLLKDIFPANAVDMGLIRKGSLLHRYFSRKERMLYGISDYIGCMSGANLRYLHQNHPWLDRKKIEINPNSIRPSAGTLSEEQKALVRHEYGLPFGKWIFVYGGNLGMPQGIDFLVETIRRVEREDVFFLIAGDGTEAGKIEQWIRDEKPGNVKRINALPRQQYEKMLTACDAGLIFLNKDFTVPNFPSRLLSYLDKGLPVIAATDAATDLGNILEENECGIRVMAGDHAGMLRAISGLIADRSQYQKMRLNARNLLTAQFHVKISYRKIIEKTGYVQELS